ncbi:MAG: ribose 5-phosphate isomerase B [Clostridia bacterium]|nr:ribose 5-phosphate isomerase B [Clostridia bacterium]
MLAIACDHAAVEFKQEIIAHLKKRGIACKDFGAFDAGSVDYPDYARPVAEGVASGAFEKGILICGTGIGMSIAANKVAGIRCALCSDTFSARATREHNDANVLALGARVLGIGLALDIVDIFVDTPFSNDERHIRRIDKIEGNCR